jgi:hypothetical protein
MTHQLVIEHPKAKDAHVKVACQGKGCPLCASTAEERARITFVRGN